MDSKIIISDNIWIHFRFSEIWHTFRNTYYRGGETGNIWREFIQNLNIGIDCLQWRTDEYIITDEKKWALSKIKYGF